MRIYDIIFKKRNGEILTKEEIDFFVRSFTAGEIPDYQSSAFLMAVFIRGMTNRETFWLTQAMLESGETLDLSSVPGIKVDKHSTGGVGDGISLVLAPLVAACGVPVPMVSGRGLGHTGGTLDKLESIPGFNAHLSKEQFMEARNSADGLQPGMTSIRRELEGLMSLRLLRVGSLRASPVRRSATSRPQPSDARAAREGQLEAFTGEATGWV